MFSKEMFVRIKYWYLFIGILIIKLSSAQENCITPDQEEGKCIPLQQCSYIYEQISRSLSNDQRRFLLQSKCGYKNRQVYICCEVQARKIPLPEESNVLQQPPARSPIPLPEESNVLPQPPYCGYYLDDRIIGGNRTKINEYTWVARLEYTRRGRQKGFYCGGTLINERYVLTAAHCVTGANLGVYGRLTGVRLGEWDTARNPDYIVGMNGRVERADPHVDVPIESVISHPDYQPGSSNRLNDIALLRLKHKVRFSDYIQPVCLPSSEDLKNRLYTGKAADVAGWGQTETSESSRFKLKATVTVTNLDQCKTTFGKHGVNIMPTHICAGGEVGIDSCRGDSGGPLVAKEQVNNDDFYFLIGVVSIGASPCGSEGYPGAYTRVTSYIDWIQRTIQP